MVFVPRADSLSQRSLRGAGQILAEIRRVVAQAGGGLQVLVHGDIRGVSPPPVTEQIALFRRARVVVGPHGGGLTNCLWQAAGSALVELPLAPLQRTEFAVMAAALGLHYWLVPEASATQLGHFDVTPAAATAVGQAVALALQATLE